MKKRFTAFVLCCTLALTAGLTGCGKKEKSVTWQGSLPTTGAEVTLYDAAVTEGTCTLYDDKDAKLADAVLYLEVTGETYVEVGGVEAEAVAIEFAEPAADGRKIYPNAHPTEKLDYYRQTAEDAEGSMFQIDTRYGFAFMVTTSAGTDYFIVERKS